MNKSAKGGGFSAGIGVIIGIVVVITFFPTILKGSFLSYNLLSNPIILLVAAVILILYLLKD